MTTTQEAERVGDLSDAARSQSTRPIRPFFHSTAKLARLAAVVVLLLVVASWFGRLHWLLELTTHFRFQYVVVLALATVILAVARWRRQAIVLALLTVGLSYPFWPLYLAPTDRTSGKATTYRAMSINVLATNTHYDEIKALIERESPDFVVLSEVTPAWADVLRELGDEYPYAEIDARPGTFGIALLSRIEPERIELFRVGRGYRSAVVAQYELDGQSFSVVGAHPYPPRSGWAASIRNQQLAELTNVVSWQQGEVLLLGDLNTTSGSPYFADLLKSTGLRDSRRGFGRQPTWPSILPAPLRIAIDHALVSDGVRVHNRRVGPYDGSDHLPIVVDFSLEEGAINNDVDGT